ncbi:MAG TPA: TIGR04149 family rSAM-modified RiPP [Mycobacteriales bacterium]|nr:TIGR04149 family rSAM-modified RiPP [Mycobacteriales bacterium]
MRSLKLRKETLAELSNEDLNQVLGGISGTSCPYCVSGIQQCIQTLDCLQTIKGC